MPFYERMEWFSHYIYAFFAGRKVGLDKLEMRALLIGSVLPDVDFIVGIWGLEYFRQYHKAFTHSIFTAPLLGILLTLFLLLLYKRNFIVPIMIGIYSHLFLDIFSLPKSSLEYLFPDAAFNSREYPGGCAFFWPFTSEKYSLYELLGRPDLLMVMIFFSVFLGALFIFFYYIKRGIKPWYPFMK